jgi:hypothetical protein
MPKVCDDSSTAANRAVMYGADVSSAQSKFGGASLLLGGANWAALEKLIDLPGDFTFEGYFYLASLSANRAIISFRVPGQSGGWEVFISNANRLTIYDGSANLITGGTSISANTWYHWAWTRSGSTMQLWLNGVSQGSATNATSIATVICQIGTWSTGSEFWLGHQDSFRVTIGVARYTSGFTPPSTEFPTNSTDDPNWNSVVALIKFDASSTVEHLTVERNLTANLIKVQSTGAFPGVTFKKLDIPTKVKDVYDGGRGRIHGTVKENDTPDIPVRREVRLIREHDARCIRSTWSDAETGEYEFEHIDETLKYTVVTYDYEHDYRAVVADNLTPELMS